MIKEIDFGQLYRQQMARSGRMVKPASDWDARAQQMRTKVLDSGYGAEFVSRMHYQATDTVLDVGCGPGTIGLALASGVKQVYGLDYSQGMLDAMMQNAAEMQIRNIQPILNAWEGDWTEVPACDIAVVSRAGFVADMEAALDKLNRQVRKMVYMTQLVGGSFIRREIMELLGREDRSLPDHMYIMNMLYQRGIHAGLSYIESTNRLSGCNSACELVERIRWSLGELDAADEQKITDWYQKNPEQAQQGGGPSLWAFMSWAPNAGNSALQGACK